MQRQEFKCLLNELGTIITDGIAYFSAWHGLMVDDDVSAHALNRYRGLFLPARNALLWMTLMQLAKVFDRDTRTISLRNLLTAAENDRENLTPYAMEEDLRDIGQKIDASESLLIRLEHYRDQRLAHHGAVVAGDVSLPYGDVRKLVEEIKSMYNSLTRGHDRSTTAFEFIVREAERHTSEVVRILCEERDKAIRRIKKADTAHKASYPVYPSLFSVRFQVWLSSRPARAVAKPMTNRSIDVELLTNTIQPVSIYR